MTTLTLQVNHQIRKTMTMTTIMTHTHLVHQTTILLHLKHPIVMVDVHDESNLHDTTMTVQQQKQKKNRQKFHSPPLGDVTTAVKTTQQNLALAQSIFQQAN
jgi:hypothetical protein